MRFIKVMAAMAVFVFLAVGVSEAGLEEGLVGYWNFDEGEGQIAKDSSEHNNNGALEGDPKWIDGKVGKALEFDGKDDRLSVPDSDSLDIAFEITMALWVKIGEARGQPIIMKRTPPGVDDSNYSMGLTDKNQLYFSANTPWPNRGFGAGSQSLTPDTWHHVVITVDEEGGIKFYLDGVNIDTKDVYWPFWTNQGALTIGFGPPRSYFKGAIDDLRIYNRALSAEEIKELYEGR